jgi:hypothetical protein
MNLLSEVLERSLQLLTEAGLSVEGVLFHTLFAALVEELSENLGGAFTDFFILRGGAFRLHELPLEERDVLVPLLCGEDEIHVEFGQLELV